MDERILEHLKLLNKYVQYLREISATEEDSFTGDYILRGSAERYLQLAIESCINIGNRIISLLQFKKPIATPESYADIFVELNKINAIPKEFLAVIIDMVRFRNRIVHIYWDIDPSQVYHLLRERLDDFDRFREYIVRFIEKEAI